MIPQDSHYGVFFSYTYHISFLIERIDEKQDQPASLPHRERSQQEQQAIDSEGKKTNMEDEFNRKQTISYYSFQQHPLFRRR